ncbi:MAG TPA: zinc ribbon domain-containing protein [Pyrinomonadaceae bacterium]|jgi:hypothetical protein|nr:zinc ribbon domain-containing protein [Pyrinomonadaceae bacterium]
MYCSSCGAAVARGLSYCNHCGAKLSGEKGDGVAKSSELRAESMIISAMVGLFILGLLAIAALLGVMKAVLGFSEPLLIAAALLSFLMMFMVEGVLVWRLPRRGRGAVAAGDGVLSKGPATQELDAAQARALPEPVPSVTEEATRTLEPAYRGRQPR